MVDETDLEELQKNLGRYQTSFVFFVIFETRTNATEWRHFFKLNTNPTVIINTISISDTVDIKYNLQGLVVNALTISWEPYFKSGLCRLPHQDCETAGLLHHLMKSVEREFNFIVVTDEQADGDWGVSPISGPMNASGEWGGLLGRVLNREYPVYREEDGLIG